MTTTPADTPVHANLLIYEDRVVGGDICSTELNGFISFRLMGKISGSQEWPSSAVSNAKLREVHISQPVVPRRNPVLHGRLFRRKPAASVQPSSFLPTHSSTSSEIPANAWPTD